MALIVVGLLQLVTLKLLFEARVSLVCVANKLRWQKQAHRALLLGVRGV